MNKIYRQQKNNFCCVFTCCHYVNKIYRQQKNNFCCVFTCCHYVNKIYRQQKNNFCCVFTCCHYVNKIYRQQQKNNFCCVFTCCHYVNKIYRQQKNNFSHCRRSREYLILWFWIFRGCWRQRSHYFYYYYHYLARFNKLAELLSTQHDACVSFSQSPNRKYGRLLSNHGPVKVVRTTRVKMTGTACLFRATNLCTSYDL